jgi:heme-degrading monooxygenase HmoA
MKVGLVAVHYPPREHWDEMIARVHRAADVLAATPGCLAVDCWLSEDNQAVVTTGQWESEQARMAGFRLRARRALILTTTSASSGPVKSLDSSPHKPGT